MHLPAPDAAQLFGAVVGLMGLSAVHRSWTVADLHRLILPPLRLDQYFAFTDGERLVGWFSWALLTPEAETGYLARTRRLQPEDWNAGDGSRLWVIDALAPHGGLLGMARTVRAQLYELADQNNWTADRAHWARCYGSGQVQKKGHAR